MKRFRPSDGRPLAPNPAQLVETGSATSASVRRSRRDAEVEGRPTLTVLAEDFEAITDLLADALIAALEHEDVKVAR